MHENFCIIYKNRKLNEQKEKHGARLKTNNLQWVSMLIIAYPLKETKTKCKEKQKLDK